MSSREGWRGGRRGGLVVSLVSRGWWEVVRGSRGCPSGVGELSWDMFGSICQRWWSTFGWVSQD